jgi:hypothetical protein
MGANILTDMIVPKSKSGLILKFQHELTAIDQYANLLFGSPVVSSTEGKFGVIHHAVAPPQGVAMWRI